MTHKILYSELQPCVLVSCACKAEEPFLMLFRSMMQTILCDHCQQAYGIRLSGNELQVVPIQAEPVTRAKTN